MVIAQKSAVHVMSITKRNLWEAFREGSVARVPDSAVSSPLKGVRLRGALNGLVGCREELRAHAQVFGHRAADLCAVPHPQGVVWVHTVPPDLHVKRCRNF